MTTTTTTSALETYRDEAAQFLDFITGVNNRFSNHRKLDVVIRTLLATFIAELSRQIDGQQPTANPLAKAQAEEIAHVAVLVAKRGGKSDFLDSLETQAGRISEVFFA